MPAAYSTRNFSNHCTNFSFLKAKQHNDLHRLSVERGSIIKDLNIGYQSLRFILLQYFLHHVIPHPTCPTTTGPRNWKHLAHVLETISATKHNTRKHVCTEEIPLLHPIVTKSAPATTRIERMLPLPSVSPKNILSSWRRHSQLNWRSTVAPRVKTKPNRNKT